MNCKDMLYDHMKFKRIMYQITEIELLCFMWYALSNELKITFWILFTLLVFLSIVAAGDIINKEKALGLR